MLFRNCVSLLSSAAVVLALVATSNAQDTKQSLPDSISEKVDWRSIGPANMGGRITAVAVYEKDPCIWWAATASGGLLKTENNGVDFEHQFDDQATVSIGDVQVAQSDPNIVWVGTGESNPRNSVSWGDGVYKSTDGGKTWTNMGLKKTFQTGALAIHPTNPDIVWVGSLGRLWGPNEKRGLFKTTDGGKTWKKVLYVDDKTGVVDVQLNPKNPDEMLVATYERKRDGFDGNDPEKRFGDGSGIFKSTDGGDTFDRVSKGLPTCKLGRIGLDYFESDPNFVYAVVESEKIGKEPDSFPYLGVSGRDTEEVGFARISRVTDGLAADKAGIKQDDIVVSVNGRIVGSYTAMLEEVYKSQAGETVKLVVVRDKKTIDIELKLGKKPENQRRAGRYFVGTLGGQGANKQSSQGKNGFEYGGIYMSKDGGSSWERINSLNPRPMYYSNIQVDPLDRNNIFLCGTSLYRSKDGGKTFTGDGGSDGIHVDHHALWIDKRDPRHMILGNDGGIHVTYDRMNHWDHLNHVAIGQFYHVGIDATENFRVYGGLQDNGSWGGPSRSDVGGMINSDWIRVGGGDGFVTLVDPEDPNQIYYESQNGGMGRTNLETGARGFVRKPRGMRFNWKTPFLLSPHNSKIHFSAGNFVLRSFYKGDKAQKISPNITNTSRGAGSALSESPMEPGVLYVGTTDGAVWMTKDGGANWQPLFYSPAKQKAKETKSAAQAKSSDKKQPEASDKAKAKPTQAGDEKKSDKKGETKKADNKPAKQKPKKKQADASAEAVTGTWNAKMITDRIPEDRAKFVIKLKLDDTTVTGTVSGRSDDREISDGSFDPETGKIEFKLKSNRGTREYQATIKDGKMTGEVSIGGGRLQIEFEGTRDGGTQQTSWLGTADVYGNSLEQVLLGSPMMLISRVQATVDDPISGTWKGRLEDENLPDGGMDISMTLKMDKENNVTGFLESPQGEIEITEGVYNPKRKRLILAAENDAFTIDISGTIKGSKLDGVVDINGGSLEIDFVVERVKAAKPEAEKPKPKKEQPKQKTPEKTKPKKEKPPAKPKKESDADKASPDKPKQEKEGKADEPTEVVAKKDDPVTGTWIGKMTSRGSDRDLKVVLVRKDNKNISGTFETTQGVREITSGTYSPEKKSLNLVAETDQFTLEFSGKVGKDQFDGELAADRFSMEFSLKRTSTKAVIKQEEDEEEQVAQKDVQSPTGEGTLSSLLPGPRWVSSIEASRFKAGRCYMTFDGHRSDDDGVYVVVTEDYGKTWKSLTENLPSGSGSARVLREDVKNGNLLFLGCEFSSWWSIDRGQTWTRIADLPTVAVHEFAIHPTGDEVVAGTHGRSLWIADVSLLRQLSTTSLADSSRLYKPKNVVRRQRRPSRGNSGTRRFVGENPSSATKIAYSLGKSARRVSLKVFNATGDEIQQFEDVSRSAGLHVYDWTTSRLATGSYRIELRVDGEVDSQIVNVSLDPSLSSAARAVLEQEDELTAFDEWLQDSMIED
ncbi:MAG: PDZ domain-containing protein [Planctomycetota bacterium]